MLNQNITNVPRKHRKCTKKKTEKMLDSTRGCICENNIFTKRDTLTRRIPEETGELSQTSSRGK